MVVGIPSPETIHSSKFIVQATRKILSEKQLLVTGEEDLFVGTSSHQAVQWVLLIVPILGILFYGIYT